MPSISCPACHADISLNPYMPLRKESSMGMVPLGISCPHCHAPIHLGNITSIAMAICLVITIAVVLVTHGVVHHGSFAEFRLTSPLSLASILVGQLVGLFMTRYIFQLLPKSWLRVDQRQECAVVAAANTASPDVVHALNAVERCSHGGFFLKAHVQRIQAWCAEQRTRLLGSPTALTQSTRSG